MAQYRKYMLYLNDITGSTLEIASGSTCPHDIIEVTFKEGSLRHRRKYLSLLSSVEVHLGNSFL